MKGHADKVRSILKNNSDKWRDAETIKNSILGYRVQGYKRSVLAEWTGNRVGLLSAGW